jgi:hypothetical protein
MKTSTLLLVVYQVRRQFVEEGAKILSTFMPKQVKEGDKSYNTIESFDCPGSPTHAAHGRPGLGRAMDLGRAVDLGWYLGLGWLIHPNACLG